MVLPLNNNTSSNASDIQSLINSNIGSNFTIKTKNEANAYYAKKGEPMYMQEMDSDEDGVVSLDEFRDYCKSKNISTRQMIKMSQMASSYRTMQAENNAFENIAKRTNHTNQPKIAEIDIEPMYAKRGDSKYDPVMDSNSDNKVSYKEYMEYCTKNAKPKNSASDAQVKTTEDGDFSITNASKAISAYTKDSVPEGKIEEVV